MSISVVVPALDEEAYLPSTLGAIAAAGSEDIEVVVVDNGSTDRTASIAASAGARVFHEPIRNIGRARNVGARHAKGDVLVFIDADTLVPGQFFRAVSDALRDPLCIGGAAEARHRPQRILVRAYLQLWRWIGIVAGMAQGAAQFCRRDAFQALGGYDESLWMGEDVDFYWRLKRLARRTGARVDFLQDVPVDSSPRRFDRWPLWQILLRTNPLFILAFRRRKSAWRDWYDQPLR